MSRKTMDTLRSLSDSAPVVAAVVIVAAALMAVALFEAGRASVQLPHHMMRPLSRGAEGTVQSVSLPTFVIADGRHPDETVRIGPATEIRTKTGTVASTTLAVGQDVIILGTVDAAGVMNAKIIRIILPRAGS